MLISKRSAFTGAIHTLDLPVTEAQLERWNGGELVQDVFPHLTAPEREFLMTGITEDEWNEVFGSGEE